MAKEFDTACDITKALDFSIKQRLDHMGRRDISKKVTATKICLQDRCMKILSDEEKDHCGGYCFNHYRKLEDGNPLPDPRD